jgi:hypothetical protein
VCPRNAPQATAPTYCPASSSVNPVTKHNNFVLSKYYKDIYLQRVTIVLSSIVFVLAHPREKLFCYSRRIGALVLDSCLQHLTPAFSASSALFAHLFAPESPIRRLESKRSALLQKQRRGYPFPTLHSADPTANVESKSDELTPMESHSCTKPRGRGVPPLSVTFRRADLATFRLKSLESTLSQNAPVTPFLATLPNLKDLKPFICHTYKKGGGEAN